MSHIFISYSRRNIETVDKFVNTLAQTGMDIWLDREDIKAGDSWRVQIVEAIDGCDAFVLMLSKESAASVNVHKEVILAQDSSRPTYVVMLEEVRLPAQIRYQLAGLQFINVPLLGFEKSTQVLTDALQRHIKKKADKEDRKQAELVIQGVDLASFSSEKQQQLLTFVASLANTDTSQLSIAGMTAGSVHLFMDMPAAAAFQLKTLALNADPRFQEQNIVSLRLAGSTLFIHTAQGALVPFPKPNPVKTFFSSWIGKIISLLVAAIVIAGIGLTIFPKTPSAPPDSIPQPASNPADDWTATPTPTQTQTLTPTTTPTETPTPTATPIEYQILNAAVANERIACNYGPGDLYLNDEALRKGLKLQVFGRDVNSGWAYVHPEGYKDQNNKDTLCWVNLEYITLDGEIENLEPVYPGKVKLQPSNYWPSPKNIYTARSKSDSDKLSIYWDAFILEDGDMERPGAPRYLLELWLCKNGGLMFTPVFAWENSVVVDDEAGCLEPSSGVIYLSEKHGYPGPVTIPWEPHP